MTLHGRRRKLKRTFMRQNYDSPLWNDALDTECRRCRILPRRCPAGGLPSWAGRLPSFPPAATSGRLRLATKTISKQLRYDGRGLKHGNEAGWVETPRLVRMSWIQHLRYEPHLNVKDTAACSCTYRTSRNARIGTLRRSPIGMIPQIDV